MYRHLSLLRLTELIANNSDRKALQELHNNRTVFYYHSEQALRLSEFADQLRQSERGRRWCNHNAQILEKAYDLTISKFSNLPSRKRSGRDVKLDGPDCRYYFEAFVKHAAKKIDAKSYHKETEQEMQAAELLQKLVVRHFRLSCLECCRTACELTRRYHWKLNGYNMSILLPIQIPPRECRKWLADNIPDVDPARLGERDRVQAAVDRLLTKRKVISLEDVDEDKIAVRDIPLHTEIEHEMTVRGLADVVADEKAENIKHQRPAIQRLGRDKLRHMIHQVFDSLVRGKYEAMNIADSVGINRATFTRFAGSNWSAQAGKRRDLAVPDLWLNTAQTLANHRVFAKAAQAAGVLVRVKEILEIGTQRSRT